jgi:putative NADH-flavin reductase
MTKNSAIAILGGNGRTGKFVVSKFIEQQFPIRLLLRNCENFKTKHPLVEIIQGDATDPEAIDSLLVNCQAVINTIGQRNGEPLVAAKATGNILQAMNIHKLRRYIVLAGLNIDTPFDKKGSQTDAATTWMKTNFPEIQEDRQKAYAMLLDSDVDWSMVRVPMIQYTGGKNKYTVSTIDCPGTSITAGDIADFLFQQLEETRYIRQAPFISN